MSKISIILPLYEIESNMLIEAVDSILNQTYTDFELIIICDKYVKEIDDILISYEKSENRIRVIRNSNRLGLAESLNLGIRESTGTYIARMDGDDISLPTRLEKQARYLDENLNIDILFTRSGAIDEHGKKISRRSHSLTDSQILSSLFIGCMLFHPTVMIRKSIFSKTNCYYDGSHVIEDYDLWTRLVISGAHIHQMREILYMYRVHSNQTTVQVKESAITDGIIILHNYIVGNGVDASIGDVKAFRKYMTYKTAISSEDKLLGQSLLNRITQKLNGKIDIFYLRERAFFMNFRRMISK